MSPAGRGPTTAASETDPLGAFVPGGRIRIAGDPGGPLHGHTFAAKEVFDVAGRSTAGGNPTLAAESAPAADHADAVARLLAAGATLVGVTVADELAYGIIGLNPHHGAPVNPAARDRFTGGSSCGSASAVAGGLCDVALGTDTGGSVRIPASWCAIAGFRPTLGRIPTGGMLPLSVSFDTVGWFARDVGLFERTGHLLLGPDADDDAGIEAATDPRAVGRLLLAEDALAAADEATSATVRAVAEDIAARLDLPLMPFTLAGSAGDLETLRAVYRDVQGHEAWATHGAWVEAHPGALGPMARERLEAAAAVADDAAAAGRRMRDRYVAWSRETIGAGDVVLLPTTAGPAPRRDSDVTALADVRLRTLVLTAPASIGGLPQVSLPLARVDGLPVGVSLIGRAGADGALLALAGRILRAADMASRSAGS